MLVITGPTTIIVVIPMPTSVGENDAATQGQNCNQGNQLCDSTKHFEILMVSAAMKPNLFIGCNMRPRLRLAIPEER